MDTKDTKGLPQLSHLFFVSLVSFVVILLVLGTAAPSAKEEPLKDVLTRAAAYVARFERDLSTIIAEERYVQDVVGGRTPEHRELTSDVLLLRPAGSDRYVLFRDVFDVDGEMVRSRDERL